MTTLAVLSTASCGSVPATTSVSETASALTSARKTRDTPAPRTGMPKDGTASPPELIDVTGISVIIEDGAISPDGNKVQVSVGEPILFYITADRSGALRMHAGPERSLPYDKGDTTIRLTVDKPGVVKVDDHEADQVVVQLEVRTPGAEQ